MSIKIYHLSGFNTRAIFLFLIQSLHFMCIGILPVYMYTTYAWVPAEAYFSLKKIVFFSSSFEEVLKPTVFL